MESDITTLAAICQVRHQQRAPLERNMNEEDGYTDGSDDEQTDDDKQSSTRTAAFLTEEVLKSVKMRFLDKLAEILCYRKDAHYVTCTAMQETDDEVTILAFRNAIWGEQDINLLEEMARQLELVAKRESLDMESLPDLQALFSEYYTPRLKYHASQLLSLIDKKKEMWKLDACLRAFRSGEVSSTDLVNIVNDLCYSTTFYSETNRLFTETQVKRVIRELGFLCRPKYAFNTFWEAAREIEGFQNINITLIPGSQAKQVPPSLSLCTQAMMRTNKYRKKLEAQLQKKKWIHAEMGMVTHLISEGSVAQTFLYLGISKKTCFMCGHILQGLDLFQVRSNHGKVYSQWTLPSSLVVPSSYQRKLDPVVQNLRDILRHECTVDDAQRVNAVKESTISTPVASKIETWSPFNRHIPDPRTLARQAEWLSAYSSRAMAGRANQSQLDTPEISDVTEKDKIQPLELTGPQLISGSCARCRTTVTSPTPCSKCDRPLYCTKMCQTLHWSEHKFSCLLGRPLDEADYFIRACQRKEFPTEDNVAKAFGFLSFASAIDRQRIFHIYCQLVNNYGVTEDELREAWRSNKLKEFLLFRGSQIRSPSLQREMYWLNQQDGFAAGADYDIEFESLLHLLEPGDRKIPFAQWKPREKLEAYMFIYQILNGFVPDADEDNWIFLGFCTARDHNAVQMLARLYRMLINRCKFQEFWKAMEQSDMIGLFDKYGLGHAIAELRNFGSLMNIVGTWHQSVWELKRFTRLPAAEPMQAVAVDYGFYNCRIPQERMALRHMYTEFFARGGDEMALHQACINGQLASFLLSEPQSLPVSADLLSNPYPLERCGYMGMIVETAILCSESNSELMNKRCEEKGKSRVILTYPDEQDEGMRGGIKERLQFLGRSVRIRKTDVQGVTLTEFDMMA
ncbi:uncharacterized protein N7482_010054 [Penicillium canariense]|uniref:MYND-type domain-containing protein n=1 Tax=Penicillium canariense TaxID=189055 RepID=A0A9W9LE19_9EURO|nr:uncharacterized protein N7482_010054 [Penicillium canariense]KAJ5150802.1 hypothetical protein N7482_010054 [Penicillium canariense]